MRSAAAGAPWPDRAHRPKPCRLGRKVPPTCGKRRSRADGQIYPSALLLMVRPLVRSPYETSTNRRADGLGPSRIRRGYAACVRALTCGDWCRFRAAGHGPSARPTCECAEGARTRQAPRPAGAPRRPWSKNPFCEGRETDIGSFPPPLPAKPQLAAPAPSGEIAFFRFSPFAKRNF